MSTDPNQKPTVEGDIAALEAHIAELEARGSSLTTCGPLCDQDHKVNEPHNRNRATVQPTDHAPKMPQATEATGAVEFEWDGEAWTFTHEDASSLEFLAELEDADNGNDPGAMIRAMRILLGKEQAGRLFKGRQATALHDFFDAAAKAGGMGNL